MAERAEKIRINCKINGSSHEISAYPMARLLDVIREETRLTGTKEGCGEGECGACSIFMNGELVNSCLIPAIQADRCEIQTIEGISQDGELHPVQKSFLEMGGAQCGICTPGMVMASLYLLKKHKNPTHAEIQEGLAGNICRCTGYMKIFESVQKATSTQAD